MMDDLFYSTTTSISAATQDIFSSHLHHINNPFIGKDVELTTGLVLASTHVSNKNNNEFSDLFGGSQQQDGDNDDDAFGIFSSGSGQQMGISEFPEIPSDLFEDSSCSPTSSDLMMDPSSSSSPLNSDLLLPENNTDNDILMTTTIVPPEFIQQNSSSASNSPQYSPYSHYSSGIDDSPLQNQQQLVFNAVSVNSSDSDSSSQQADVKPLIISATAAQAQQQAPPPRRISRGRVNSQTPLTAETAELAAMKRHIRMIRNRESASLSRKKKKEYVTSLEERIKVLENQINLLKEENSSLRVKLAQAVASVMSNNNGGGGHHQQQKKGVVGGAAKIALFSLCFFCAVLTSNHVGTSGFHGNSIGNSSEDVSNRNLSRVFVPVVRGSNNNNASSVKHHHQDKKVKVEEDFAQFKAEGNETIKCGENSEQFFFNVTESRRVQSRLEGLFKDPLVDMDEGMRMIKKNKKSAGAPLVYSLIAPTSFVGGEVYKDTENDVSKGLTVYNNGAAAATAAATPSGAAQSDSSRILGEYASILQKLERREDTFYVVSLTAENYLLLSAKNANESSRPKMTLLMPWRNETSGGREELMQIDCEVFQVFNLNKKQQQQQQESSSGGGGGRGRRGQKSPSATFRRSSRGNVTSYSSSSNRNSSRRG